MNILINTSNLKAGGGLQVGHSVLEELRQHPAHQYTVAISKQLMELIDEKDYPSNFSFIPYTIQGSIKSFNGRNEFLDKLVVEHRIEKVFSVFGPTYWMPKVTHICGFAKAQYLYKDSPFFDQLSTSSKIKLKLKEFIHLRFFGSADVLVTENADISARLQLLFPKRKIFTVTNYYNQIFEDKGKWAERIELAPFDGTTLLTIATNYSHKNLQIIPKVIKYLKKENPKFKFRFALSLSDGMLGELDDSVKEHIVFLGKIDINQCPGLYEQSDIMFLPTLLECFSASYAEAMYMKVPILTSDLPFARGLCGNAAIYVDTLVEKDVAEAIILLSENKDERSRLVTAGEQQLKTFDNFAERTRKYIEIIEL